MLNRIFFLPILLMLGACGTVEYIEAPRYAKNIRCDIFIESGAAADRFDEKLKALLGDTPYESHITRSKDGTSHKLFRFKCKDTGTIDALRKALSGNDYHLLNHHYEAVYETLEVGAGVQKTARFFVELGSENFVKPGTGAEIPLGVAEESEIVVTLEKLNSPLVLIKSRKGGSVKYLKLNVLTGRTSEISEEEYLRGGE